MSGDKIQAPINEQASQSQETKKEDSPKAAKPRKPVAIRIIRAIKRAKYRDVRQGEEREAEHQENERAMARWSGRVGWFTAALVLFAFVSACISYRQWRAMLDANGDTHTAADAATKAAQAAVDAVSQAKRQADVAETALSHVQRAYLFPASFGALNIPAKEGILNWGWTISPLVENSGETPAISTIVHVNYRIQPNPMSADFDFGDIDKTTYTIPIIWKDPINISGHDIPLIHLIFTKFRLSHSYIWGWLRYSDVFSSKVHESRFCYELVGIGGDFVHIKGGNIAVAAATCGNDTYSCVDEACKGLPAANPYASSPPINIDWGAVRRAGGEDLVKLIGESMKPKRSTP